MTLLRKPTGTGKIAFWLRRLWDECQANRITHVYGMEMTRTSNGTTLAVVPGKGGTTHVSCLSLAGEYVTGHDYTKNQIVAILTGPSQGTYVCVKDRPGTATAAEPGNGTYWFQLPMGSTVGDWT